MASSPGASILTDSNSVSVNLNLTTTNNMWTLTVGKEGGFKQKRITWLSVVAVTASLIFSWMFLLLLISKEQCKQLLWKMMPKTAIKKLQRGGTVVEKHDMVTIFFSDIVGYTGIADCLTPMEIMSMLNKLYTKFD
mmetsp:Transcript_31445/g.71954  ORF Transcript_31445/g.71954 Transcript_31445/m.71954 type:complete len:136 (-) Transcript_31445:560-967(-)